MAKVLLLEDEVALREEVADFLRSEGHQVQEAGSVAEFTPLIDHAEIAIIDVGLPDGDGFAVAESLSKTHPHIGAIMLTARGSINDKINGLRKGADHYLIKPIRLNELSAYVSAIARRIVSDTWRLNMLERSLCAPGGHEETMSALEMTLLELLARNAGKVVSRPDIARAFGTDWLDYDDRHLDQLVSRLRRRWQNRTGEKLPLRTEHGQGYSFCVDIEVL
ncbi:DNA-binding response regulator [Noviherbaspirillum cavernae]|uniref:DNA-binding response regulator n=1 Tax=Noviherbaspirillum cavernae TaxID=2320862 RepID=A0A418X0H8_9BURK|nr:response regulator transcription factor [Noviherbaspirillum cavernae]RJG05998.1 DNA-binding response regulator [Noviherbaspirillum cavernae]